MQKNIIRTLTIILILSIFGVVSFAFMDHNVQHDCPIEIMYGGGDCVGMTNTTGVALHHISGFRDFIQIIVSSETILAISLVLIFSLLSLNITEAPKLNKILVRQKYLHRRHIPSSIFSRILKWLALRNKGGTYPDFFMSGYLA